MSRLFVRNIPSKAKEADVQLLFSKVGKISDIVLKTNFAFVQFENHKDAVDALSKFKDCSLFGNKLSIELAKSRVEKLQERIDEKCFKCGDFGHWAKDCKVDKKQKKEEKFKKFRKVRRSPKRSFSRSVSSSPSPSASQSRKRSRSRSR